MIVRVQLWLSRIGMESSCHLLTFLCKPFISGDLLCGSPPGGQEDPGPQTREQVQGLVPEIRLQTKAAQVISGTSQDTMGSLVALLRLTFLSISRGFTFGFYLVLLYFSFLFLLLCLRLKGLKYAKHVVYHRAAIPATFFFQKFYMNIVHTNPPLVADFFRNSKSQGAGPMCLVCQPVDSLLRVTWVALGALAFPGYKQMFWAICSFPTLPFPRADHREMTRTEGPSVATDAEPCLPSKS